MENKSNSPSPNTEDKIQLLERRLKREVSARKEAEKILESKSLELFKANKTLNELNTQLEQQVGEKGQILNSLIDNLHAGMVLLDRQGLIVTINEQFKSLFKVSGDQFQGEISGKKLTSEIQDHFKSPETFNDVIFNSIRYNRRASNRELVMGNGTILDCDFIPVYSETKFIGQLWQFREVTDERIAQQKIQESEEKYRGIIENMELGLLEVDLDHKIMRAYESFGLMTGYSPEELIGEDARKLFLDDHSLDLMSDQDDIRQTGEQSIYEIQMRTKSGEKIWVLISGAPYYDSEGNVIGSIGIHYNITARKKLEVELRRAREEAETARAAEQQFLANMSHEIRNPLNAIIGLTNLLYDTEPSKQQMDHLNNIKNSSEILLGLISDVLDFSKIATGNLELSEKEINIYNIVEGILKIVGFNTNKDIKFINKLKDASKFDVIADSTVFNQIFLNLLGNALKFTENGSIAVIGERIRQYGEMAEYAFKIVDTGIGISASRQDDIFESFKQADKETKLKYGGTGLGLSIVKKLVLAYGGDIQVQSEEGKGTTFEFNVVLPISRIPAKEKTVASYTIVSKGRMLIVEDNSMNQQYLSGILSGWGIPFDIANNGLEALNFLEKHKYDMILMDIRMPKMDGYETTIRLRSNNKNANCQTPIIALTASAQVDEKQRALDAGMNDHITKPFLPDDLAKTLSHYNIVQNDDNDTRSSKFEFAKQLDGEHLNELYGENWNRASRMFELYLKTIDKDVDELEEHLSMDKWDDFAGIAHRLKPSFAMVGLNKLSEQMNYFQQANDSESIRSEAKEEFKKFKKDYISGNKIVTSELTKIKDLAL